MHIENNILKHYLRNCYFITGTAYAGKSTMCAMLAEKYDMVHYSENYGIHEMREVADPVLQPNLCYTKQMPSWEAFVTRTPEEYNAWIERSEPARRTTPLSGASPPPSSLTVTSITAEKPPSEVTA